MYCFRSNGDWYPTIRIYNPSIRHTPDILAKLLRHTDMKSTEARESQVWRWNGDFQWLEAKSSASSPGQ